MEELVQRPGSWSHGRTANHCLTIWQMSFNKDNNSAPGVLLSGKCQYKYANYEKSMLK